MNKIYRDVQHLETQTEGRTISGYAIVFESWSRDLGGFTEIIHKEAISQELLDNSDVIMNVNHNDDQMLARYRNGQGTLKLELREDGLYFEFEAPETALGDEILYHIKNGNLFECSFCFALPETPTCENWYIDENNFMHREIKEIAWLHDVSIVNCGAYPATNVDARSADKELAEAARNRLEEERKATIINQLDDKLKEFLTKINI